MQAKEHVDIIFIMHPKTPFSLIVTISIIDTITDTIKEVIGPHIKPLSVIMISLGSYFKNSTWISISFRCRGIQNNIMRQYENNSIPHSVISSSSIQTILLVLESHQILTWTPAKSCVFTLADFTANRESHPALKICRYSVVLVIIPLKLPICNTNERFRKNFGNLTILISWSQ